MSYIYPENLNAETCFWFWRGKDLLILVIAGLFSVLLWSATKWTLPLALTVTYGVITIRLMDDLTILDHLVHIWRYLFGQRLYFWR